MKLLTIFSAFFLPLTFIVGVYGMNFDIMPELRWENGYFFTLGLMLLISLAVFGWFKRRKII
jgi:magnesium transporter